ncbi:MAG: MltA domain-containing protein [Caulobacter sp.]|nr:MltA domain-containing protein [Caulobacter sp.]
MRLGAAALLAGLLTLAACAPKIAVPPTPSDRLDLRPTGFESLPGWAADRHAEVLDAFLRSCEKILSQPDKPVGRDGLGGKGSDWLSPCLGARKVAKGDHQAARQFFEGAFRPWAAMAGDQPEGLFTGYYEAELSGSRKRDAAHQVPLYGAPRDLVGNGDGARYASRAEIETVGLGDRAPVLLWLSDPVDLFFLQVQGSGRVKLPKGEVVRVGFAGSNGHPFTGIGKIMQDRGLLKPGEASMQAIRAWLKANPAQGRGLMRENPRYVFFRLIEGDGPIGAQGVALTAGRSLAVDPRFVPMGAPLWLSTRDPDGLTLQRLMVAQDTGSAIKGAVRGDFFWGFGEPALEKAGRMKSRGRWWLLLPNGLKP